MGFSDLLNELTLDELAELLKSTTDAEQRKQIVREIGKRNSAGETLQESNVAQEETASIENEEARVVNKQEENKRNARVILAVAVIAIILLFLSCRSLFSGGGGGGGSDLDSPEWDRYFGCLELERDAGASNSESRETCERYRP